MRAIDLLNDPNGPNRETLRRFWIALRTALLSLRGGPGPYLARATAFAYSCLPHFDAPPAAFAPFDAAGGTETDIELAEHLLAEHLLAEHLFREDAPSRPEDAQGGARYLALYLLAWHTDPASVLSVCPPGERYGPLSAEGIEALREAVALGTDPGPDDEEHPIVVYRDACDRAGIISPIEELFLLIDGYDRLGNVWEND